jgi:radical SAM protein with 4Fe4S-binding SPASM domain
MDKEPTQPDATITERHFGIQAHEDLGAAKELRSLWIEIPDYCHLLCDYCFASTKRGHPHHCTRGLGDEEYLRLLDDFRAAGGRYLGIPGNGEPFHPRNRELVLRLLRHASDLNISTTVFTTGDAIFYAIDNGDYGAAVSRDPDFSLAQQLLDLGVILLVKFNSTRPEVQDSLVKQPGYTAARARAMKWLVEMGFTAKRRLGIVTSILPENKDEIVTLYEYAKKNDLIFDCDTILPRGRGRHWKQHHDTISQEEYHAIYQRLNRASGGHFAPGGSYIGLACDRVKHHLYVDIKGDVYPCIGCVGQDRTLRLGNVRHSSLASLWNHRFRVQLRDRLAETVSGPCAWCENFEKTCWSCLGRLLEHCEIADEEATLMTRGCFNHRPRLSQWMAMCNREIRRLILRIGRSGYDALRKDFLSLLTDRGMEALWSVDRKSDAEMGIAEGTRPLAKDIGLSSIRLTGSEVWQWIRDDGPGHVGSDGDQPGIAGDDQRLLHRLKSLLPTFFLPTLKILADRYDRPLGEPTAGEKTYLGLMQFCLFMFYMPDRNRYFYRTIAFNHLDESCTERESTRWRLDEAGADVAAVRDECRRNSRRVRLVQRWAEAIKEGEDAPILPHIRNLSREMESDFVNTYELILCQNLFTAEAATIDREQRFYPRRQVLGVGPLLDCPGIASRVKRLAEAVDRIIGDDRRWKPIEDVLSNRVFAWQPDSDTTVLREAYADMALAAFYDPNTMSAQEVQALRVDVYPAVCRILGDSVWMLPKGSEAEWFGEDFQERLQRLDWKRLFDTVIRHRRADLLAEVIPEEFDPGPDAECRERIVGRLYSRLLVEFLRLFRDDNGNEQPNWIKAVNYFIWLGYYRDTLGIRDYFVLHAPNLQQQCSVLFQETVPRLPASAMILSSRERLPTSMREDCEELFRTIVSPIEELSFAHWGAEAAGRRDGEAKTRRHFTHELNTPLAALQREYERLSLSGKLSLDYVTLWHRFASRSMAKYDIPPSIARLFASEDELLMFVVSLALMRVGQEGKVPSYRMGEEYVSLTAHELIGSKQAWMESSGVSLDNAFRWLSANLPPEAVQPCERTLQTLVLSLSIGALHHLIEYAFGPVKLLNADLSQIFAACRKGLFSIAAHPEPSRLRLVIRNTGGDLALSPGHELCASSFGSNLIGKTEWHLPGCCVSLEPFSRVESMGDDAAVWQAVILVRREA